MMKIERKHIILIICGVSLLSWIVSFIQGWGNIQFQWFVGILAIILVFSGFTYKREAKVLKLTKIKSVAENYLKDNDLKDTTKITRIFRRDKLKSDKLWDVVYDGNPTTKLLLDLKGEPVGLELKGETESSPLKYTPPEKYPPQWLHRPRRVKEEIKKEIKTD